ncbi:MAG: molybdopterin synthase catalytic subunit, partial [Reinekea sp.]
TASPHRDAAFAGAQFIMDWLKTRAPIWKKENTERGEHWLEAKVSDADKADQW